VPKECKGYVQAMKKGDKKKFTPVVAKKCEKFVKSKKLLLLA
jgi:hypothetical protein